MSSSSGWPSKPAWTWGVVATAGSAALAWALHVLIRKAGVGLPGVLTALPGLKLDLAMNALRRLEQLGQIMIAAWLGASWIHVLTTRYKLAGRQLTVTRGLLAQTRVVVPLSRIRKVEIRRPALGRLLGYGHVVVDDGTTVAPVLWHARRPDSLVAPLLDGAESSR